MHLQEKEAWFTLSVIAITLGLYFTLIALFGRHEAFMAVFGFFGLLGFAPLIGRKQLRSGKAFVDERDQQIARTAWAAASAIFWLCFVAAAMTPFFVLGSRATLTISTGALTTTTYWGMSILLAARSLVIIVLYRRGAPRGQE